MGRKSICRKCKKERSNRNRRGICINCQMNKIKAVNKQLKNKKGKHYKLWKTNLLKSIEKMA